MADDEKFDDGTRLGYWVGECSESEFHRTTGSSLEVGSYCVTCARKWEKRYWVDNKKSASSSSSGGA